MAATEGSGALEALPREECLRLLATQQVGRLGVVVRNYPLIFPVNFGLDRGVVVVRTRRGALLSSADHANVAFEVDELDVVHRTGWSVLVRGLAEDVSDLERDEVLQRSEASAPEPWVPGEHDRLVRIIPHDVSGRRIHAGQQTWAFEPAGYL